MKNNKTKENNNIKLEMKNKYYNEKFSSNALLSSFILDRLSENKKR